MADHLEIYRTAQSLPALFFHSAEGKKRKPFLWTKQHGTYVSESWGKIHGDIVALAKALKNMGVNAATEYVWSLKTAVNGWFPILASCSLARSPFHPIPPTPRLSICTSSPIQGLLA